VVTARLKLPELSRTERDTIRPRERLPVKAWARRHVKIVEGPLTAEGADVATPWDVETFPLQEAIIDAIDDPRWSKVLLMTAPQAFGKTQCAAIPTLLHALEHRRVSALYVAASLHLANTQWRKKFQKAMEADDDLAALFFDNPDFGGSKECRYFRNGTALHMAGADSVGSLSAFTCQVIVVDDLQAHPEGLVGFGHPADIAYARKGAYPQEVTSLVGMGTASTVTAYLWRNLVTSAFFCPFVPCLDCGTYQLIEFERLQYPEDVKAAVEETWLSCAKAGCTHRIVFDELPEMLAAHRWASTPPGREFTLAPAPGGTFLSDEWRVYPETDRDTTVAGFWANAFYWPLGDTWGQRAADWLSRRGDPDEEKDYLQAVRVVPWQEPELDEAVLTVEQVAEHAIEGHRHGTVPVEADLVTLTADVHDQYLYYIVRAWKKADGSSWLVDAGTQGVHGPRKGEQLDEAEHKARVGHAIRGALEDLWQVAEAGWPVVTASGADTGRRIWISLGLVDSGYRPDAVTQFVIRANVPNRPRVWRMIKGRAEGPIWVKKATSSKYGHVFHYVNTSEGKHAVRELLAIPRDKPGAWLTYADKNLDAYHRHLVAEHFVPKDPNKEDSPKVWKHRPGAGPNHWWDDEVYQVAAAIACGVTLPSGKAKVRTVETRYFSGRPQRQQGAKPCNGATR
jgi:phage terminase large subunit GpA-like protein